MPTSPIAASYAHLSTSNFRLMFPDRCQTAEQCHPERYSAKDLASAVEARSFASTLRMTRPFSSEHHCGYMSPTFDVQCSMFSVRCSVFDVQCSMFDVRCSMFDVECSRSNFNIEHSTSNIQHRTFN